MGLMEVAVAVVEEQHQINSVSQAVYLLPPNFACLVSKQKYFFAVDRSILTAVTAAD
jgi:hypothetical protein